MKKILFIIFCLNMLPLRTFSFDKGVRTTTVYMFCFDHVVGYQQGYNFTQNKLNGAAFDFNGSIVVLNYAFNKCIKYLSKSVTAEEDSLVLDALLQNTSNIEKDCEENSILIVENVAYFLELYRKQNINVHN